MVNKIPLSVDEINERFEYKDGVLYRKISTCNRVKKGDKVGCPNDQGYLLTNINGRHYRVHRIIFFMFTGRQPNYIDHIDGDPSNNKIENLQEVTQTENMLKARKQSNNTSGTIGVSFDRHSGKWRPYITIDKKCIRLKRCNTLEEAIKVRKYAEIEHYGEFPSMRP